jgi:hypothetical protein
MSSIKTRPVSSASPAAGGESVYSARLTLKEWLTHLEDAGLLKPGATGRILTNRKLKRITLPVPAAG